MTSLLQYLAKNEDACPSVGAAKILDSLAARNKSMCKDCTLASSVRVRLANMPTFCIGNIV